MFEELQVRNFRRNKKRNISLGQITTIRGATGKGKSSLVGAFKWACFNRPSGDSFINWDSDFAAVRLVFDRDQTVIRRKSSSNNTYKLNGEVFKAFGTNVPDPVSAALNVSDINFRLQAAGHFWFSETAGEVSRQLNDIVNLSVIDGALAHLASCQREARTLITHTETHIKTLEEELKELDFVDAMSADFDKLSDQYNRVTDLDEERLRLEFLTGEAVRHRRRGDRASKRLTEAKKVLICCQSTQKMARSVKRLRKLIDSALKYKKKSIKKYPNIYPLLKQQTIIEETTKKIKRLKLLINNALLQNQIASMENMLAQKQAKYDTLMKGRCPLCGRK